MTLHPVRTSSRWCRILLMALACALGGPRPKLPRHEDPVVQVAGEESVKD